MNRIALYLLASLSLAADGAGPEQDRAMQGARVSAIAATRKPSATSSTTAARSPFAARSASGLIGLTYEWLDEGAPGASGLPLRVRVSVFPAHAVDSLIAEVYSHDGLVVTPASWATPALQARQRAETVLTVTPYVTGPLRFSVLVQGRIGGQAQAAQISVPLPNHRAVSP